MKRYIKLFFKYFSLQYFKKLIFSVKNNGIIFTLKKILSIIRKNTGQKKTFTLHKNDIVTILTPGHTFFVASLIQAALSRCNIQSEIISDTKHKCKKNTPYIVICPQVFKRLPRKRVIFFQMEQYTSRWFTPKYYRLLNKADIIFDYSIDNIEKLLKENISFSKLFYLPISFNIINDCPKISERKYDILFYGDISSPRRKKFLDAIGKRYNIKIATNHFGDEIRQLLLESKIVLNIHYYPQNILETTRLYEAISHGCIVISESSSDIDQHSLLKDVINFVDCDDIDGMISTIDMFLSNEQYSIKKQEHNLSIIRNAPNLFNFFFYRFLFYIGFIDFDRLYTELSTNLKKLSNKVCLSLPETPQRYNLFKENNKLKFDIFPGIRHPISWIGCGLSYKFLLKYMAENKYPFTIICEDDCDFPPNFSERFEIIYRKIMSDTQNWDIFSGFIADLSQDVHILDIEEFSGETFITIDKTVSMVFMIYSQKAYHIIDQWDYTNTEQDNTIDRFIENKQNLRIILTHPFLVGHQEKLNSTLWEIKNSQYNDIILKTHDLLIEKISKFKKIGS